MEDFINAYCQELTADMNFRVRAKKIYQFEGMALDPDYADRNAQELAHFYAMCGSYQFKQYADLNPMLALLSENLPSTLPYHNAIAFFQRAMEMDFANQSSYIQLNDLLPYVLSCYGFVFGTSFYAEGLYCLHPCDLAYTVIEPYDTRKIYAGVLRSQAELRIGSLFQKEKKFYGTIVRNLSRQKEQIEQWIKEAEDKSESTNSDNYPRPWKGDIEKTEEMFWSFFEIYDTYCKSQINPAHQADLDDLDLSKIANDLDKLKKAAQVFFKMERILSSIETITTIKDKTQNIQSKVAWLDSFHTEIITDDTQSGLNILKDFSDSHDIPELYNLIFRQDTFSTYQL